MIVEIRADAPHLTDDALTSHVGYHYDVRDNITRVAIGPDAAEAVRLTKEGDDAVVRLYDRDGIRTTLILGSCDLVTVMTDRGEMIDQIRLLPEAPVEEGPRNNEEVIREALERSSVQLLECATEEGKEEQFTYENLDPISSTPVVEHPGLRRIVDKADEEAKRDRWRKYRAGKYPAENLEREAGEANKIVPLIDRIDHRSPYSGLMMVDADAIDGLIDVAHAAQDLYDNRLGGHMDSPQWSAPQPLWVQLGQRLADLDQLNERVDPPADLGMSECRALVPAGPVVDHPTEDEGTTLRRPGTIEDQKENQRTVALSTEAFPNIVKREGHVERSLNTVTLIKAAQAVWFGRGRYVVDRPTDIWQREVPEDLLYTLGTALGLTTAVDYCVPALIPTSEEEVAIEPVVVDSDLYREGYVDEVARDVRRRARLRGAENLISMDGLLHGRPEPAPIGHNYEKMLEAVAEAAEGVLGTLGLADEYRDKPRLLAMAEIKLTTALRAAGYEGN